MNMGVGYPTKGPTIISVRGMTPLLDLLYGRRILDRPGCQISEDMFDNNICGRYVTSVISTVWTSNIRRVVTSNF
jgi:hypothetical protein